MNDIKGVMITGANGGIGRALAEKFAGSHEYRLILHVRKIEETFIEFCDYLSDKYSTDILKVEFDLTDHDDMSKKIRELNKNKISVDILINNAGMAHGGFFQMTSINDIKDVFEVNYFAAVKLSQLVARGMTRKGRGAIINVASIAGIKLESGNCAYGASKAALIAFTQTGAQELAPYGVRMNAVAPGPTDTRMAGMINDEAKNKMINDTSMHRLCRPEEVAEAIYYLASDAASFINGQVLRVDGGVV